ncbi:MAG: cell division protein FtsA [Zoogloeaceae bacterium]|jgi:cell division protein FtsA|nr:cell division protein FtsA [Zoogloeaceae bacterium]
MSKGNKDLIVALDIGTSMIVALVAELTVEGELSVIGRGTHDSRGLKNGVVVNIEETVDAISGAIAEAELMADCKVDVVYTGIAGSHIRSFNSDGMVAVADKEVSPPDVARALETARARPMPTDQEILHVLPQEFIIDEQGGIREPIGMNGKRLEVKVHIVTGAISAAQNIIKCVRRCGLEVSNIVLQPLASSYAVLSQDEKDLGVCMLDIGGGTTDIAIWTRGAIRYTAVIPDAGDLVTTDIAMMLHTPRRDAEDLKCRYGCALAQLTDPEDFLDVPGVDERPPRKVSRHTLANVIQARVEEIYEKVLKEIVRAGYGEVLSSGIVITGGASLMPGMVELGEEIFHMSVRQAVPRYSSGGLSDVVRNARFSTAYGLLLVAQEECRRGLKIEKKRTLRDSWNDLIAWFGKNF